MRGLDKYTERAAQERRSIRAMRGMHRRLQRRSTTKVVDATAASVANHFAQALELLVSNVRSMKMGERASRKALEALRKVAGEANGRHARDALEACERTVARERVGRDQDAARVLERDDRASRHHGVGRARRGIVDGHHCSEQQQVSTPRWKAVAVRGFEPSSKLPSQELEL